MRKDHGFAHGLDQAVVTVQPAEAGMVYIRDVMAEAGFFAVVIDDSKELVGSLLVVVLVLAVVGKDVFGDLQVDGKVNVFQQLLASGRGRFVINETFQMKDQDRGKLV